MAHGEGEPKGGGCGGGYVFDSFRLWLIRCVLLGCGANAVIVIALCMAGIFVVPFYHLVVNTLFGIFCSLLSILIKTRPQHVPWVRWATLLVMAANLLATSYLDADDAMKFAWHFPGVAAAVGIGGVWAGAAMLSFSVAAILSANAAMSVLSGVELTTLLLTLVITASIFMLVMRQFLSAIRSLEDARDEAARLARTDPLTGLQNRQALREKLDRLIASNVSFSLILIDLDRFKAINDTYGHMIGDLVLGDTARTLTSVLREGDLIARFGGEEFCAILVSIDGDVAVRRVETMRRMLEEGGLVADGHAVRWTGSFGVVHSRPPHASTARLLSSADAALYEAKKQGRNRYSVG